MPTSKGDKGVYVTLRLPEDFPKELAKPKLMQEFILKTIPYFCFVVKGKGADFTALNPKYAEIYKILFDKYKVEVKE